MRPRPVVALLLEPRERQRAGFQKCGSARRQSSEGVLRKEPLPLTKKRRSRRLPCGAAGAEKTERKRRRGRQACYNGLSAKIATT